MPRWRARSAPFVPNTIGLNWAGPLILAIGTEAQKQRYIRGMLSCDDIWCQGFSEPDKGSDLAATATKAVRDGDHYVLNGSKIWTSLGSYAKYMILLARTDPPPGSWRTPPRGARRRKRDYAGLSFFLIPMDAPGIRTVPIKQADRRVRLHPDLLRRTRACRPTA
jgi:alkylation response protein AidB-like acyl-CoA dehydrogenase